MASFERVGSEHQVLNDASFSGGLNTTGGPLSLNQNESSDLKNVDFDKFGSILKRNGSSTLNSSAITNTPNIDGLHWFEYVSSGSNVQKAISIADGKFWKMDSLDGTWDQVSEDGSVTFTGSGANDATSGGTYTGLSDIEYKVVIDAEGTPDTFEWFKDNVSQASGVAITGSSQNLDNGLTITFVGTDNHTLNDQWVFHPAVTITADYHCSFTNFLNNVYITNGEDRPFKYNGTDISLVGIPSGLTDVKYNEQYNNYLFYANVVVSGTTHKSRIYWSTLKDTSVWPSTNFIDISRDDGQEITGIKVLADRLVIYKTRSIYNLFFTGDSDVPFILPGGGKSNSSVGCVAPFSIQEVNNGHVFFSYDGFYFYDGNNSYKISDKITTTIDGYNKTRYNEAVSLVQKDKNRYWCAMASSGSSTNDVILVWDYFNNAWTVYDGLACSSLATFYVSETEERPYFGDYAGFVYRADDSSTANDAPLGVATAIDAYYYTNWRALGDLINQKGIPEVVLYFLHSNSVITFGYSYDFEGKDLTNSSLSDQFSLTVDLSTSAAVYGTAVYDTDVYAASAGGFKRLDLNGRGRLIRFRVSNSTLGETFRIDGLGSLANLETNV